MECGCICTCIKVTDAFSHDYFFDARNGEQDKKYDSLNRDNTGSAKSPATICEHKPIKCASVLD